MYVYYYHFSSGFNLNASYASRLNKEISVSLSIDVSKWFNSSF